jgi:hypothetical protein
MSKYYSKIENFIYHELNKDGDLSDYDQSLSIESSRTLSLINKVIRDTRPLSDKPMYETVVTKKMAAIHSVDQMPVIFLFFASLYDAGLMDQIVERKFETLPNLNDFWEFHAWYRANSPLIKYEKIDQAINQLPKESESFNMLKELYNLLYHNEEGPRATLNNIYRNPFVSLDVQHDIESTDMIYQKIRIELSDEGLGSYANLEIFYADPDVYSNIKKPDMNLIAHIVKTMKSLHSESRYTDVNNLKLTMIMSAQKKMFDGEFLGADNVNSGSTYPGKSVTVWRMEEVYKVLIHELIHFYGFDFGLNHPDYEDLKRNLSQTIDLEGPDAINETYTETLATIINAMFYANYRSNFGDQDANDTTQKLFDSAISLEIRFMMWQVAKIVHFYNGPTIESLLENEVKLVQTTSVRSYYVFKLFMYFNLNNFIKFVDDGGKQCGLNICDRLIEFGNLIISSYNNFKNQKRVVAKMNNHLTKLVNNVDTEGGTEDIINRPSWVYRTCRMTAIEIIDH